MKSIIVLAGMLTLSLNSYADQNVNSSSLEFSKEAVEMAPQGLLPFIGFGGGYTGNNDNVPVEGTPVSLKLLGSYYLDLPYVFDAGFGISNQQFSQSGAKDTAATGSSLEFAARYRFANAWQAGLVANHLFEMGSNYAASQGDAQFVGVQALKEFAIAKDWLARVGGRAMTETNNTGEMVNMYMIDLQLGWNPHAQATTVKSAAAPVAKPAPVAKAIEVKPTSALEYINYASFENGNSVFFQEASYSIDAKNQTQLQKLAALLKNNKNLFTKVEVHGYADISGSESLNQSLSEKRAEQVKAQLIKGGLHKENIVALGKGSSQAKEILAQDRKVELLFTGVKDEKALQKALAL